MDSSAPAGDSGNCVATESRPKKPRSTRYGCIATDVTASRNISFARG
jgi:hypothetical protein